MITTGILSTLLVAFGTCASSLLKAHVEMSASAVAEDEGRRLMERLIFELRFAEDHDLANLVAVNTLSYSSVTDWDWANALPVVTFKTLALNSGRVLLDGTVIAAGVEDLTFRRNGNLLTIVLVTTQAFQSAGKSDSVLSRQTAQLRIKQ